MFVLLFFTIAFACAPQGGPCSSTSDCCPNLCSSTSCLVSFGIGTCVGSICKPYGTVCNLDCECCTNNCEINDLNFGTCGVDTKRSTTVGECGVSCVNCRWANRDCNICCPIGVQAWCTGGECHCGLEGQSMFSNVTTHYAIATSGIKYPQDNTVLAVSILASIFGLVIIAQFIVIIKGRTKINHAENNKLIQ